MFIDFLTLLLINMTAAFVLLAAYVYFGLGDADQKRWVTAFAVPGAVAAIGGFYMTFTWPIIGAYNIPYGEMSTFLGIILLATALNLAKGWSLTLPAVYAFFAGAAAILLGVRIMNLGLTQLPAVSGVGFILSGLAGVFATPTLWMRHSRAWRVIAALVLLAVAGIWAVTGYGAYWNHMTQFSGWTPLPAR